MIIRLPPIAGTKGQIKGALTHRQRHPPAIFNPFKRTMRVGNIGEVRYMTQHRLTLCHWLAAHQADRFRLRDLAHHWR
jgi:hypothetical protein